MLDLKNNCPCVYRFSRARYAIALSYRQPNPAVGRLQPDTSASFGTRSPRCIRYLQWMRFFQAITSVDPWNERMRNSLTFSSTSQDDCQWLGFALVGSVPPLQPSLTSPTSTSCDAQYTRRHPQAPFPTSPLNSPSRTLISSPFSFLVSLLSRYNQLQ